MGRRSCDLCDWWVQYIVKRSNRKVGYIARVNDANTLATCRSEQCIINGTSTQAALLCARALCINEYTEKHLQTDRQTDSDTQSWFMLGGLTSIADHAVSISDWCGHYATHPAAKRQLYAAYFFIGSMYNIMNCSFEPLIHLACVITAPLYPNRTPWRYTCLLYTSPSPRD